MILLSYVLQVVACILFVDFLSGLIHWLEDGYGGVNWPIIGKWVVQPNIRHHQLPSYFLKHNWLESAIVLLVLGFLVLLVAWHFHFLDWHTWLIVILGVNANEFHKWAHRSRTANGLYITFLQKTGLLQSPAHHARHHRGKKNRYYCSLTNYLNPILEAVHFWIALEFIFGRVLHIPRRNDDADDQHAVDID